MHIVFQFAGATRLAESFDLDESLRSEIFVVGDDYSVGPLVYNRFQEQLKLRREWWQTVMNEDISLSDEKGINDLLFVHRINKFLEIHTIEKVFIWVAPNAADLCGYYHLLGHLYPHARRVEVIHLDHLPFIHENGSIFFPKFLAEIPAREFVKAKKLAREVSAHEWEADSEEWKGVCAREGFVRGLAGARKLSAYKEDHFDQQLLSALPAQYCKLAKIVQTIHAGNEPVSPAFLKWRIRKLAAAGQLELAPEKEKKDIEVRKTVVPTPKEIAR